MDNTQNIFCLQWNTDWIFQNKPDNTVPINNTYSISDMYNIWLKTDATSV